MNFYSTRSTAKEGVSAAFAIKNGLAPDGGLYMPEAIPSLTKEDIKALCAMDYPARAAKILSLYLTDYTEEELLEDCRAAYASDRFVGGAAPLHEIGDGVYALELFHGPTCAFKDMALQIMPRLLSRALKKTGETRTALILVATSGDTGKAALEGYRDIPGIRIQVFYPSEGVSHIQKLQMTTQEGSNVDVCGIYGNFDDAQSGVKRIFSDKEIASFLNEKNVFLSSANSINWGRLAPQIAYYVSAYCDMLQGGKIGENDPIDVTVPTGNFGNIFAAFLAKKMGVPIRRLICASNSNNVLTEFIERGVYNRCRPFHMTVSPSMDILISSNLERLLYVLFGAKKTANWMKELNKNGSYSLAEEELAKIREHFLAFCCSEEKTAEALLHSYEKHGYLMDTHTAVGYGATLQYLEKEEGGIPVVVASTASPYKFAPAVLSALHENAENDVGVLDQLASFTGTEIPKPLCGLSEKKILHPNSIDPADMADRVLAFAQK